MSAWRGQGHWGVQGTPTRLRWGWGGRGGPSCVLARPASPLMPRVRGPWEPPPAELPSPPPSPCSPLSLFSPSQVVFPPGSPIPLRRTFSVLPSPLPPPSPLLQHRKDASSASTSPPLPSPPTPCGPSGVQSTGTGPQGVGVQGPAPCVAAPRSVRSIGCQTDEDPLFPPMQAGLLGPSPTCACPYAPAASPLCARTHARTHVRAHTRTHTRSALSLHPQGIMSVLALGPVPPPTRHLRGTTALPWPWP